MAVSASDDVLKYYKIYVKYALMFVSAVLIKCIFDYMLNKPVTDKKASRAPHVSEARKLCR